MVANVVLLACWIGLGWAPQSPVALSMVCLAQIRLQPLVDCSALNPSVNRYCGRSIAIASLHRKERILARPLLVGLGLNLRHASAVDTNQFGSFSGEQLRLDDAPTTCRRKAEAAMEALGLELGIASEGSFGPHPAVPMLPVGLEWMTFVDRRDDLVISENLLSRSTNYSSCQAADPAAIAGWLRQVGFPRHALMVRPLQPEMRDSGAWLAKGVHDPRQLAVLMAEAVQLSPVAQAWLETDMRAHCNPTRRAAIRQLAFRLVRKVASRCPACGAPGWGVVATVAGLPCGVCGLATRLVNDEVFGCVACSHQDSRPRRDGRRAADPMHCDHCNP